MMLTAKHMEFDRSISPEEQIWRISVILGRSPNAGEFLDAEVCLPNYIHRQCWLMGISPLIILMAFQREQSLLTQLGNLWGFKHTAGVVGQDQAGTANIRWDGLPMQVMMASRSMAWSMGIIPKYRFEPAELVPSWTRYSFLPWARNEIPLYGSPGKRLIDSAGNPVSKVCADPYTYAQYVFTPHLGVEVTNERIYNEQLADVWPVT